MIKLVVFLLLILGLGLGFAWLADMPGQLQLTIGDQLITVELITAAALLLAIVVAVLLVWWLVKFVFTSPQRIQRFFKIRRRDRGYQALSTGIIAAGAGDPATAHKMLKRAGGLIDSTTEPLIQLLDAQATLLEGKYDDARKKFEEMLGDPELRDLGLRGLYMEAQRLGDREAQKHYAEKAAELSPQLAWANKAALDFKTVAGDWDNAILLLDKQKSSGQVTKDEARRKRAVLLTAMAQDSLEKEPTKAKRAALEAHKLEPGFAPAAIAAGDALIRLNEMRRAAKVLETTWKKEPHPEVALAYIDVRPGDSAQDRLKRARKLDEMKPNTIESSMIVAQMAFEAGEYETAKEAVSAVLRNNPRESAFMLMADIEDAQSGDQGLVREWLSRAVRAPRDPAWTADGYVAEKWAPFSPVTGRIDAFEWKVPVERLGAVIDAPSESEINVLLENAPSAAGDKMGSNAAAGAATGVVLGTAVEVSEPEDADSFEDENEPIIFEPEEAEIAPIDGDETEEDDDDMSDMDDAEIVDVKAESTEDDDYRPPVPDDPGVDPNDNGEDEKPRGFRLF